MPYDEGEEEVKRLEEARRRGGVVGLPNKPAAPASAAAPAAPFRFGKPFSPLEMQKQSAAYQVMLRKRAAEDAAEAEKQRE